MPITSCREDGKPGFRAGSSGKCFTYSDESSRSRALNKAKKQLAAIKASQAKA